MRMTKREVPGSNGRYFIDISTPEGKCLSKYKNGTIKELSNKPDRKGYIYWRITVNGMRVTHQAGKWIAMTFPELVKNDYFEGAHIDHIDTVRLNNHPSNLRWVTVKENCNNPFTKIHMSQAAKTKIISDETRKKLREVRKGENNPFFGKHHSIKSIRQANKKRKKPVVQSTLDGTDITYWFSCTDCERETGMKKDSINKVCLGKQQTAYGYKWRYAE